MFEIVHTEQHRGAQGILEILLEYLERDRVPLPEAPMSEQSRIQLVRIAERSERNKVSAAGKVPDQAGRDPNGETRLPIPPGPVTVTSRTSSCNRSSLAAAISLVSPQSRSAAGKVRPAGSRGSACFSGKRSGDFHGFLTPRGSVSGPALAAQL